MSHVTLKDIAVCAGLSTATVSKVVNGRSGVSRRSRESVLEAVRELGYRMPAPALKPGKLILFVASTWTPYSATVLAGAIDAAAVHGLSIVVRGVGDASNEDWLRQASEPAFIGVIGVTLRAEASDLARSQKLSIPVVFIDPEGAVASHITIISSANRSAARGAVEQLMQLGHERIGVLGGSEQSSANLERIAGCRSALDDRGMGLPESHVVNGAFDFVHGYHGAKALLAVSPRLTAVVALADVLAAGAMRALDEAGLAVPGDVSLVSFDDTEIAQLLSPDLTAVRQPLRQMGGEAVDRIRLWFGNPGAAAPTVWFGTDFISRQSTASPRPGAA